MLAVTSHKNSTHSENTAPDSIMTAKWLNDVKCKDILKGWVFTDQNSEAIIKSLDSVQTLAVLA